MGPLLWLLGGGLALGAGALALRGKTADSRIPANMPVKIGVSVLLRDPAKVINPIAESPSAMVMLNTWTAAGGTIDNQVITIEASRIDATFLENAAKTAYFQAVSQGKQCNYVVLMNSKTQTVGIAVPTGNPNQPLMFKSFQAGYAGLFTP